MTGWPDVSSMEVGEDEDEGDDEADTSAASDESRSRISVDSEGESN